MKTTACSLMWTTINTEEYNMNILEKTLKTYGKEGKRKYQQIKINKRDNLQDGTVYVLTEEQYEEIAIYEKQLKEYKKSVLTANEENSINQISKIAVCWCTRSNVWTENLSFILAVSIL